jgi:monoamine oxidase
VHRSEVLVVGAGLSGLACARRLADAGRDVRVLEARDRVGGRTLSQRLGTDVVDLGGQWIGPGQTRVQALVRELGVETFPQHHEGDRLLDLGGRLRRYRGTIPRVGVPALAAMGLTMWRLERLRVQVPTDQPWAAPNAERLDGQTLADWMRRQVPTEDARALLSIATRAIFAAEPRELSFLHFLAYLNHGGGLERLAEVEGGAQERRLVGGVQQLSERLAETLGERVHLSAPVRAIDQGRTLRVETDAGAFEAERVVVALSPALAGRIHYTPALPGRRDRLSQRMPMGSALKVVAAYERPFWRERGFSGEAVSDRGPLRLVMDDSSHDGSQHALVAFFLGETAARFTGRPVERRAAALEALARFFGPEARTPMAYVDQDWVAEPNSRGCYVGNFGPGVWTTLGQALREPCGRIHWAGTETAREWMGYFEGALEAGERAALEVLNP